mgnify:CR=1 FL=1
MIRQITKFMEQFDFDAVVPVSAQTGDGVGGLVDELKKQAMPGAHFFGRRRSDRPAGTCACGRGSSGKSCCAF